LADESLQDVILAAFLAGVKAGAMEEAKPIAERTGRHVGKRLVRGRAKDTGALQKRAKRRVSAYSKAYGKNFKRIAPKNQKKDGSWKKDGFKKTQKAAHAATKKEMK